MAKRKVAKTTPMTNEYVFLDKNKSVFSKELEERISIGEELFERTIQTDGDYFALKEEYSAWSDYNLELLKQSFNKPNSEYWSSYKNAGKLNIAAYTLSGPGPTKAERLNNTRQNIRIKINNLKKLLQKVDLLKSNVSDTPEQSDSLKELDRTQIFIVHGHDDLIKIETARFIEKLGFEPIILHEKASAGMTIIEKIADYSNVGFGIVLYTPCDIGSKKGEDNFKGRARQNVVFEHGYLIGKIGRENVCALIKGEVETPNDISGVVYISMDNEWKLDLAKELRSSGYEVDMNLVI